MTYESAPSLEEAFARAQTDAESASKSAAAVQSAIKRYIRAAQTGHVSSLETAANAVVSAVDGLLESTTTLRDGWSFDVTAYMDSGAYSTELIEHAAIRDVQITQLDKRLYCYPSLLRVQPGERSLQVNKKKVRDIRPSAVVMDLQKKKQQPVRFRATQFLETLYSAYQLALPQRTNRTPGSVVPLLELYRILTMKPGDAAAYPTDEFGRDVYLLDRSGEVHTANGSRVEFHAGAAAGQSASSAFRVVTQRGQEQTYAGIAFKTDNQS